MPVEAPGAPRASARRAARRADAAAHARRVVGQGHLIGEGSALRTALESGQPHSMILSGRRAPARRRSRGWPPCTRAPRSRSSPRSTPARPRCARCSRGRASAGAAAAPTIFFLDEIHRFNKAQQDELLPAVEDGIVTLIGATTENPYFEVNSALLSRTQVYELYPLNPRT